MLKQHIPLAPQMPAKVTSHSNWRKLRNICKAQQGVHKRRLSILSNIWWEFMPGTIIEVKWPCGWVVLNENDDGSKVSIESADPNDHYRPDLEKHVGRQGMDWDWRIGSIVADNGKGTIGCDTMFIKMRKGRDDYASIAKLKWM